MAAKKEDDIPFPSTETGNKEDKPNICFGLSQTGGSGQNVSGEELNHHIKTYTNATSQNGDDSQRCVDSEKNNNLERVEIQTPENEKNNPEHEHYSTQDSHSTGNQNKVTCHKISQPHKKEPTNKAQGITEPPLDFVPLNNNPRVLDHEDSDRTAARSSDTSLEPLVGSSRLNDRKQLKELQKSGENITKEKVRNNKPQEILQPCELKELLHKFLQKPTCENVREDNIVQGDCIEMNGMCGKLYKHYAIVESVDGDKIRVTECGLRDCNLPLLLFLMTIALVLHDLFAMLAKVIRSTYTLQQLEARKAKKIIFPEELQRYIDRDKTLKNTDKRRKEPDFLYSLSTNNCEHLVWWCLFDLEYSHQASESHRWYLYLLKVIELAVQLLFKLAIVMKWPYIYVIHELCLAVYNSCNSIPFKETEFQQ